MKAVCPNNSEHHRFVTVAHIAQDWIVDEEGNFVSLPDDPDEQVVAKPDPGNIWTCQECGAEAKVTP